MTTPEDLAAAKRLVFETASFPNIVDAIAADRAAVRASARSAGAERMRQHAARVADEELNGGRSSYVGNRIRAIPLTGDVPSPPTGEDR